MNYKYITIFTVLTLIACSSSSDLVSTKLVSGAVDNATNCVKDGPAWLMTPSADTAVGIGNSTDLSFSRTLARTDASAQLAAKIDLKLQDQLNQIIVNQNSEFARSTKQAISATVSSTINLFDVKQYYLCPRMIGGKEGYESFAYLKLDAEKMKARLSAEIATLRADTKEDEFKSLLDSFGSGLDALSFE